MMGNVIINENDFEELMRVRWGLGVGMFLLSLVMFFGMFGINFVVVFFVGNVG